MRAEEHRRRIIEKLPEAKQILCDRFCAKQVFLFGSLLGESATEYSDVDFAVRELRSSDYFEALTELSKLLDCSVDLVELETASERLKARILAEGKSL